jgi:predicted nucleotide-binding protein
VAKIHPEILKKLQNTLGVGPARVYELISQKVGDTGLPRNVAALKLAAENDINISKKAYATEEERALLRGAPPRAPSASLPSVAQAQAPRKTARRPARPRPPERKSNSVFVVHGRNKAARDAMFALLRALGLKPIEWTQAVKMAKKGAPYVGEVLAAAFNRAAAVVVLLTPDDEARLRKKYRKADDPAYERTLSGQARQNVIFEAGRAFGSHPTQTIIVELGKTKPFSDTGGIHAIRLSNDAAARRDLAQRLETAGCEVDTTGTDWLSVGDFTAPT